MVSCIRRLRVERFRGIKSLTWHPAEGVNVILGGGDVGKSTVLDAIALLLSPTNSYTPTDSDYWRRDVDSGFLIEAVMSLPDLPSINQQRRMHWPWVWNGKDPVVPVEEEEGGANAATTKQETVYVLQVRGTAEMEVAYEIVQPDDNTETLSVGLRREIGLVRLAGDDRNDRDLRLVQGSGLDRLLADKGLRSRLGKDLAGEDVDEHLKDDAKTALSGLESNFGKRNLPTSLGLGITGGPGLSLNALVGLTADKEGITLPLASWGAGTRRLAALAIADQLQGGHPISVVDEVERGLEPYRQRVLMKSLRESGGQVFVTTHSAAAISAAMVQVHHGRTRPCWQGFCTGCLAWS
jgi:putative ATP-dependent endonuclease of OLD family